MTLADIENAIKVLNTDCAAGITPDQYANKLATIIKNASVPQYQA